jgi:hypothetical protein
MRMPLSILVVLLGTALPALALGCGVCIEDKVAATYDHAIVAKAAAKKQVVVFGAVDGVNINASRATERIIAAAADVKGVQRGTARTSVEPSAFSFALDPRAQTPEASIADLQRRIDVPGLRLTFIRVMP